MTGCRDDPSVRDPSGCMLNVQSRSEWDEDALKRGCKLMHEGMSLKLAAREVRASRLSVTLFSKS